MPQKNNSKMIQVAVFFLPEEIKMIDKEAGKDFLKTSPFIRQLVMKKITGKKLKSA